MNSDMILSRVTAFKVTSAKQKHSNEKIANIGNNYANQKQQEHPKRCDMQEKQKFTK